uniref:Iron sulphur domain-containing protein n=1 Tax=Monodelphis domestica TaxID=13616 RepID=A0A5F8HFY9_MONDO
MVLKSMAQTLREQFPNYLKQLLFQENFTEFKQLTVSELFCLVLFLGVLILTGFLAIYLFLLKGKQQKVSLIDIKTWIENLEKNLSNLKIQKRRFISLHPLTT